MEEITDDHPIVPPPPATSAPGAYARAVALGFVSGLRSQTAIALVAAATAADRPYAALATAPAPWRWLAATPARAIFALAAAGEYVGDKLPQTPSRLDPGPLGGRFAFGALTGAAACRAEGRSPVLGGALGALGALGGSYAGARYRGAVADRGFADLPFAILEDAAAIIISLAAVRSATPGPDPEYSI